MQTIENNFLKVSINELGGNLTSIIYKPLNIELLYQVEEGSWPFQDVVIFPLIGAGHYVYNNKKYEMKTRHGFVRNELLTVTEKDQNKVSFTLSQNENTLKEYPFKFTFTITYELIKSVLKVNTTIINNDTDTIYFSYASHTGLKARSLNGSVLFDKDYKFLPLISTLIEQNNTDNILMNCVNLKKETFKKLDTLVFEGNNESLILQTGFEDMDVKLNFDAPYFAIWSNPNKGEFVCIEPWWGISNYIGESKELKDRVAINKIKANDKISFAYSFDFIKNN